jgi:hypothetical protein
VVVAIDRATSAGTFAAPNPSVVRWFADVILPPA